jgi:hypothetical protein
MWRAASRSRRLPRPGHESYHPRTGPWQSPRNPIWQTVADFSPLTPASPRRDPVKTRNASDFSPSTCGRSTRSPRPTPLPPRGRLPWQSIPGHQSQLFIGISLMTPPPPPPRRLVVAELWQKPAEKRPFGARARIGGPTAWLSSRMRLLSHRQIDPEPFDHVSR